MCSKVASDVHHSPYDALLLVSFGGPEGPEEVLPFLENVVSGRNIPHRRLLEVARHYELLGGVSPINSQNRALLAALADELNAHGPPLPVYWGNRHWHPMLADTLRQMTEDGVRHALAFVASAFGSYPGCRQYVEDIERARREVGPGAPPIDKLRLFFNHPGFIEATVERVAAALSEIPVEKHSVARLLFTAHGIPVAMAERSPYLRQLRESCRLVAERLPPMVSHGTSPLPLGEGQGEGWDLVFQSRSGPPSQPWLEPDIRDHIRRLHEADGLERLVIAPIGFLAENMEVVYDLDVEVRQLCDELGVGMVRAAAVGNHPRFVSLIRELIVERLDPTVERLALGALGPWPDECPTDCCHRI